ncbi:hypothetical protein ES703_52830 [subsurface metagenome]
MASEVKHKCFVIMPFSKTSEKHTKEYWTKHYETFIKPLIESGHPLIAERSAPLRGDILRQIITDLVTAPIVVADLTDANPNVYWELGVRQSFKHCTVTIAEDGTPLPFDVGGKGTLFYFPGDHIKMREFESEFHEAIEDCLKNPHLPDSHVLETISGRGTLFQILARDESIRRLEAVMSEIERNETVLEDTFSICNKNIRKRKEALAEGKKKSQASTTLGTGRFRYVAVEMLIVSRYIDADKTFYNTAERYLDLLISTNDQLPAWEHEPESTESWLLETYEGTKSRITKFKSLVLEQKKAIETIL